MGALTIVESMPDRAVPWAIQASTDDASGTVELKAAETGKSHYIQQLRIETDADVDVDIGTNKLGVGLLVKLFGPMPMGSTGGRVEIQCNRPVQAASAQPLFCDASGAGTIQIYMQGFTL